MEVWDLPFNKKDTVQFFQNHDMLSKRPVCGSGLWETII